MGPEGEGNETKGFNLIGVPGTGSAQCGAAGGAGT